MKLLFRGYNPILNGIPRHCCLLEDFHCFDYSSVKDVNLTYSYCVVATERGAFLGNFCKHHTDVACSKVLCKDETIVQVSVCNNRGILLNEKGELSKILPTDKNGFADLFLQPVTRFLHSDRDRIVKVACGAKISVALSKEGKLFRIPDEIPCDLKIKDILAGREHCMILDERGTVYTFGTGSRGQLGHGSIENEEEPILVKALEGIRIVSIAAGGWHSCALSEQGDLYTWGWNSNGQLGIGDEYSVMATPHVVDFGHEQANVVQVACGTRHTIALSDTNQLYGCGWNKYKQILKEEQENVFTMVPCYDLKGFSVFRLACGPWNSVILCQ